MNRFLSGLVLLCQVCLTGPALADETCKTIFDSYTRLSEAPGYRQTVSLKGAVIAEQVMVGNDLYSKDGDTWSKQSLGEGTRKALQTSIMPAADALRNCTAGAVEPVDDVQARQYSYSMPPVNGVGDLGPQRVWIGEDDGLPHRLVSEKQGTETRVRYDDVKPPL